MNKDQKVTILVTLNGVVLLNDKMTQEELQKELQNSFKSLMSVVNLVTKLEGRKGLTHVLEIDDQKTTFKGGSLGGSMVRALLVNQIAENKGAIRIDTYRETVKAQISALPISGRTVEAVRVFDRFIEGKAVHTDVKKALLPAEPKATKVDKEAKAKAEKIETAL